MHYKLLIITKQFPDIEMIAEIMKPYDEDSIQYDEEGNRVSPYKVFDWDWFQIGGRYSGSLKLKVDMQSEEYRWRYYERNERNGRLFHSKLLSDIRKFAKKANIEWRFREEDYFQELGFNEGFIRVDGAKIADLLNFDDVECFACIDKDGNAIARESWNGNTFVTDEQFDEKFKAIKENSQDCYVTVIDMHD